MLSTLTPTLCIWAWAAWLILAPTPAPGALRQPQRPPAWSAETRLWPSHPSPRRPRDQAQTRLTREIYRYQHDRRLAGPRRAGPPLPDRR